MEARELRIGNLIKSGNGIYKVVAVSVQGVEIMIPYDKDVNSQNGHILNYASTIIKPIPLTEEWEKKFGVEIWTVQGESWRFVDAIEIPDWIEYVHELQNWYYWTFKKTELKTK